MTSFLSSAWAWLLSSGLIWWVGTFFLALILGKKSQIQEWAEANPRRAGILKILRSVGFDPWMLVQGAYLIFSKKLPPGVKPPVVDQTDTETNPKLH